MNVPYIDFHTHSLRQADTIEVVSLHNDQQKVVKLYTIGFHPCWTTSLLTDLQLTYLAQKFTSDANCLGIGECGLDHLKGTTLDIQEEIFLRQILVANHLNAPVIIHCVRTFDRLLSMRKKYGHTPWAVHGFVRNKILAKQILDAGICISVAPHPKMNSTFEDTLSYLPIDKIFWRQTVTFLQISKKDIVFLQRCEVWLFLTLSKACIKILSLSILKNGNTKVAGTNSITNRR
ncbi:MAG: TatD family hydrolase [Saprospiraceae bacterium]|nr:TatD family hydrolase [Saprospiraceae bacterium]